MMGPLPLQRLQRLAYTRDGIVGRLGPYTTLEDEENYLAPGLYRCVRSWFYGGDYATFEILAEGHSRVLFHIGNTTADTRGCTLVGSRLGVLGGRLAVLASRAAFQAWLSALDGTDVFYLLIEDA